MDGTITNFFELIFALVCVVVFLYFYSLAFRGSGPKGKAFMVVTTAISLLFLSGAVEAWGFVAFYLLFLYVIAAGIKGLGYDKQN
jgi:hypothetical protein|tara:strand:- start:2758 stop:3012 length:255 start_codon:yes stop_codon:yes gene_type:complete